MAIRNDREKKYIEGKYKEKKDIAGIYKEFWTDYRSGNDICAGPDETKYPNKFKYPNTGRFGELLPAGDEKNPEFKAKKIEFFRLIVT